MRSSLFLGLYAGLAVSAISAAPAFAQQLPAGGYLALGAGAMWLRDVDASINGVKVTGEYDTGYHLAANAGYRLGNGLRVEGEFSYNRTSVDKLSGGGITASFSGVDLDIMTLTANVFYDFDTGSNFRPYIGVGAGIARWEQSSGTVSIAGFGLGSTGKDSGSDLTLLGEAGISIAVAPQFEIVPAYRYQWINDGRNGVDNNAAHIVKVSLRYSFH